MPDPTKSTGQAVFGVAAITAAATTDLGASALWRNRITAGAGSISSFGARANAIRFVEAGADVMLVAGANMVLPGGRDLPVLAGDTFEAHSSASGVWTVRNYQRAHGGPVLATRGLITGLTLSNNVATPNTKIDVAAGQATDATGLVQMTLSAGVTVDFGTTGAAGLDAGAIAASTWYHLHLVGRRDGTCSVVASTSVAAPTLPSGYLYSRRIGSVRTNGSTQIIAFVQTGDRFEWATPVVDAVSLAVSSTAALLTLTVPTGLKLQPILRMSSSAAAVLLSDPDRADVAVPAANNTTPGFDTNSQLFGLPVDVLTDTSGRVRHRCNTSGTFNLITRGWRDSRGRHD